MRRLLAQILIVGLLGTTGCLTLSGRQTDSRASRVKLGDLSFMTGLWRADWNGGVSEEHWSSPFGDSLVGTFHFVKDGKSQFYELMLIELAPHGPVLRLKHFDAELIGWEDKTQVYSYPLIECRKGVAIFERQEKKSRLIYSRASDEILSVVLEEQSDGKTHGDSFTFTLIK